MSNINERSRIASFEFCMAPGHIGNHGKILIEDEYLSIIGVPIVRK